MGEAEKMQAWLADAGNLRLLLVAALAVLALCLVALWRTRRSAQADALLARRREAELQARVDRSRVHFVTAGAAERGALAREVERFREQVQALARAQADDRLEVETECDTVAGAPEPEAVEVTS